jgi:hypothetical protein
MGKRVAVVARIRERDFLQAVRDYARLMGWADYHTWKSVHSPAGFPDLVLVRPPRVVFAELKVAGRRPTPAQEHWHNLLRQCPGVEFYLWTPEHWTEIEKVLSCCRASRE